MSLDTAEIVFAVFRREKAKEQIKFEISTENGGVNGTICTCDGIVTNITISRHEGYSMK